MKKNNKNKTPKKVHLLKISLFSAVLVALFVVGLLLPLRPTVSEVEKRNLAEFPKITWKTFWSGQYFSDISTWYADTFPFRENLIDANFKIADAYGIKGDEQIVGPVIRGDEVDTDNITDFNIIPTDPETTPADTQPGTTVVISETTDTEPETAAPVTEPPVTETEPVTEPPETEPTTTEDTTTVVQDPPAEGKVNGLYVVGDTIYELYFYGKKTSERYAAAVSSVAEQTKDFATVYSIIIPKSYGFYLTDAQKAKLGVPDEAASINATYSAMTGVKPVGIYSYLDSKKSEYIYFRTDHHWTALGAYYAYQCFCTVKGVPYKPLESYEHNEYPGFLGTLYADANKPAAAASNPDTVHTYTPSSTNTLVFYDANWRTKKQSTKWPVVKDVSGYGTGSKYLAFIAGDNAFEEIHNPDKSDGSSCLVIKDSFGNAFVPFLVDDYQDVYVMDFRYFKRDYSSKSIPDFARELGVNDIIFCNNITMVSSSGLVGYIEELAK